MNNVVPVTRPSFQHQKTTDFSAEDLLSDDDEEPAFAKKETSHAVALMTRGGRLVRPLVALGALAAFVIFTIKWQDVKLALVEMVNLWVHNPAIGFLLFLAVHLLSTLIKLPNVQYVLIAGYVGAQTFGPVLGIVVGVCEVFIASVFSSSVAFLVGRSFCLRRVQKWVAVSRKLEAVANLLRVEGLKMVIMLRMASVLPFGTTNYVLAAMDCRFQDYVLGSVGLLPYIATYAILGASLTTISEAVSGKAGDAVMTLVLIVVSVVITLIISIYITQRTRRALGRKENEERRRSLTMRRNSQMLLLQLSTLPDQTETTQEMDQQ